MKSPFDLFRDELRDVVAKHYSVDGVWDSNWESELQILDVLLGRLFEVQWRRHHCTHAMVDCAIDIAARWKLPDVSDMPTSILFPAYWVRNAVLNEIGNWENLGNTVDNSSPQRVIVPYSEREHIFSLAYLQWQGEFMVLCDHEITRRIKKSDWNINMFRLIELGRDDANERIWC